ncbi:MAG: hypothetical protein K9K38_16225 [Rhodoferax sp.]|nr:hypothetical protein [Rhodoferax sp.]
MRHSRAVLGQSGKNLKATEHTEQRIAAMFEQALDEDAVPLLDEASRIQPPGWHT